MKPRQIISFKLLRCVSLSIKAGILSLFIISCISVINFTLKFPGTAHNDVIFVGHGFFGFERNVLIPGKVLWIRSPSGEIAGGIFIEWSEQTNSWWSSLPFNGFVVMYGNLETSSKAQFGHMNLWRHRLRNPICIIPPGFIGLLYFTTTFFTALVILSLRSTRCLPSLKT